MDLADLALRIITSLAALAAGMMCALMMAPEYRFMWKAKSMDARSILSTAFAQGVRFVMVGCLFLAAFFAFMKPALAPRFAWAAFVAFLIVPALMALQRNVQARMYWREETASGLWIFTLYAAAVSWAEHARHPSHAVVHATDATRGWMVPDWLFAMGCLGVFAGIFGLARLSVYWQVRKIDRALASTQQVEQEQTEPDVVATSKQTHEQVIEAEAAVRGTRPPTMKEIRSALKRDHIDELKILLDRFIDAWPNTVDGILARLLRASGYEAGKFGGVDNRHAIEDYRWLKGKTSVIGSRGMLGYARVLYREDGASAFDEIRRACEDAIRLDDNVRARILLGAAFESFRSDYATARVWYLSAFLKGSKWGMDHYVSALFRGGHFVGGAICKLLNVFIRPALGLFDRSKSPV